MFTSYITDRKKHEERQYRAAYQHGKTEPVNVSQLQAIFGPDKMQFQERPAQSDHYSQKHKNDEPRVRKRPGFAAKMAALDQSANHPMRL